MNRIPDGPFTQRKRDVVVPVKLTVTAQLLSEKVKPWERLKPVSENTNSEKTQSITNNKNNENKLTLK
jgi:hypothetical protein